MRSWSDEDKARLRYFWLETELTAEQIGEHFGGASRGSIIGAAHRYVGGRDGKPIAGATPPPPPPPPGPPPRRPKTIMHLRADDCRWPLWDVDTPAEKRRYCCQEITRTGLSPYCAEHQDLSVAPRRA